MRKRQRPLDMHSDAPGPNDALDANNVAAIDSAGDDDDDDDKPKARQKRGGHKINIEFIGDKKRRRTTFGKRKTGIMKKAYEISTLTGTQVMLLIVSEEGMVYTFTTAKLQPLVTQADGTTLIRACLKAPDGTLPSSIPAGAPLGPSSGPMGGPGGPAVSNSMPGGLSISGGPNNPSSKDPNEDDESSHGGRASRGATSAHSSNAPPPTLSIPCGGPAPQRSHSGAPSRIALGSPTSPQQQHQPPATSPGQHLASGAYHHPSQQQHQRPQHDSHQMGYPSHLMSPTSCSHTHGSGGPPPQSGSGGQPLGGLAAAAVEHSHLGLSPQGQVQGGGYGRQY
ncbi:SRF-type transcription factor (DNA-binding and dimerization domain)-domain-containing protein [Mycena vitilis]|nr:SRF-type transcription factor (DNA-binding and dimerization domain)-domain-containing protein [Mycena vitilis]